MDLSPAATAILGHRLALANTASYLYRWYSQTPSVELLSAEPSDTLVDELRNALSSDQLSFDTHVKAHALIVAMLMQSPRNANRIRSIHGIDRLRFATSLLDIAPIDGASTTVTNVRPGLLLATDAPRTAASTQIVTVGGFRE